MQRDEVITAMHSRFKSLHERLLQSAPHTKPAVELFDAGGAVLGITIGDEVHVVEYMPSIDLNAVGVSLSSKATFGWEGWDHEFSNLEAAERFLEERIRQTETTYSPSMMRMPEVQNAKQRTAGIPVPHGKAKRIAAWLAAVASALLAVLYFLNLPFYSGSSVGSHFAWRMEHGRMRVKCEPAIHQESFYVDFNSEGMRFSPEWRLSALDSWDVNVPLWMPLGASVLGSVWLFRISRRAKAGCRKCGYDLKGLPAGARCPECGGVESSKRKVQSSKGKG